MADIQSVGRGALVALLSAYTQGKHQSFINDQGECVVVDTNLSQSALNLSQRRDLWELTGEVTTKHSSLAKGIIR